MVTPRCLPLLGGVETHVAEVARRIAARGVELTVLTTDVTGALPAEERAGSYLLRRFPAFPRGRDYYLSPGLAGALARSDPDLVHVQGVHTAVAPLALAVAHLRSLPTVLSFHTGGSSSGARRALREAQWRLEAPLIRRCARLVAVCDFEREAFARRLGIEPGRIALVRNGSEPLPVAPGAATAAPPGSPLLASIGRLERYKGHHRLIAAMPRILAAEPGAHLAVVGEGPFAGELRALVERLGVGHAVTFLAFGPERRAEMGALVAACDAVALLSDYEAHPVAVMEALAAGVDVVVAATSGLTELGRAGLVELLAPGAGEEAVARALLAAARRRRWAGGPPPLPTWDECAEALLDLYEEVARSCGS